MKKGHLSKVVGCCILALLIGGFLYFNQPQEKKKNELVIAINLPLSGPIAVVGSPYAKGFEMGIKDELKAQNLPKDSVRLLMDDNQGQAMVAATLFKHHELNNYDVYIAGTTEMANAIVNNIRKEALFIPVALDEEITSSGTNNIRILANFNLTQNNLYSMIEKRSPKKVAVIAGCPICQQFAERKTIPFLQNKNIDYHEETFEWGFKEFRSVALKIKKYKPDLILVNATDIMDLTNGARLTIARRIPSAPTVFSVNNLTVSRAHRPIIIKPLSFDIHKGDIALLEAPNG